MNLSVTAFFLCYCIIALPVYYFAEHPWIDQYKIQKDKPWPWLSKDEKTRNDFWALTKRSAKFISFNIFFLVPAMSYAKITILSKLEMGGTSFATDEEAWPKPFKSFVDCIILSIIHEFGFYATHRLCHVYPFLYKYHKVHHEYKMNVAWCAQHNHPVDFILSIGGPGLLAVSLYPCHSMTQFQFILWTMYANLDDHCGFSFPWSPVRWFPFAAATDEHEFHHSKNIGCFGSKLDIYNRLLGGHEHYLKWNEKREEAQ